MKRSKLLIFMLLIWGGAAAISAATADTEWKSQKEMKLPAEASVLAYSSDGTRLAVGHKDGRVSVWNIKSGALIHLLNAHTKEVNSVQFISKDAKLITIGDDYKARIWATAEWRDEATIDGVGFSGGRVTRQSMARGSRS